MDFIYRATIAPDPDGGFLVTFDDVPSAITHGDTREDAVASASEALGLALRGLVAGGQPLPAPAAAHGVPIAVPPTDAIKLAVIECFRTSGITKTELSHRMGKGETEARRVLDPDHPSKIGVMQDALKAMGQTIVISTMELV